ncbi:hypothetical protein [Ottowia sp.]|uniref:hypothetical protein n=1 Tax=Ottowia sp. TaxID=1898956 RepID=UPI003A89CE08
MQPGHRPVMSFMVACAAAWLTACGDGVCSSVSSDLPNVSVGIGAGECDDVPSLSKTVSATDEAVPAQ